MRPFTNCAAAIVAAGLITGTAHAADQTDTKMAPPSQATTTANRDFGKLSHDGFAALRDIRLARLAIFDGNTSDAKQDIDQASDSLQKAESDDSVFIKAESDLKTPDGMAPHATDTSSGKAPPNTTPVKWLPVDGAFTLGEDYVATPEKSAAIGKADAQIKQGNHDEAMDALKLAHVNVVFDVEVAPLDKTIAGVNQAKQLVDNGKYFEANQALKNVEDGMRYDVEDFVGMPTKTNAAKG
jgi:hypothetical protein